MKNIVKRCGFSFKIPTILDSNTVYIIRFDYPITNKSFKQYGYLYIQTNNYAILQTEYYVIPGSDPWLKKLLEGRPYLKRVIKKYKSFNNKYYLNYVSNYEGMAEDVKISKNTFPKRECIVLINNLALKRKKYEKIRLKSMEKKDVTLYKKEFKYNPQFWKNYNILLANPISSKTKQDLEKEKQLETQFKENAKQ